MNYKELKEHVAQNKFIEVFRILDQGVPEADFDLYDELLGVEAIYEDFQRKYRVLSNNERLNERREVADAIIELIDNVSKKISIEEFKRNQTL